MRRPVNRSRARRHPVECGEIQAHLGEQGPHHRQQQFRVALPGVFDALRPVRAIAERDGADIGRRVEREDLHGVILPRHDCVDRQRMRHPVQWDTKKMDTVVITALDQEGRGVARVDGKAIFVEGALIGERVAVEVLRRKPSYELASMTEVHAASPARAWRRPCPHFGICGGCSLQHRIRRSGLRSSNASSRMRFGHIARVRPMKSCRRSTAKPVGIGSGPGCRCATSQRKVACSSVFTSGSRASSPT
jgi:predicted RNA-binding protein with TRAM domain